MSNQVLPQNPNGGNEGQNADYAAPLSENLYNEMIPQGGGEEAEQRVPKMFVSDFSMGAYVGGEEDKPLPQVHASESTYIPLSLALDYVKKVTTT